jgi:O-antigen ligase
MTGIFYNRNALGLVASVLVVAAAGWWRCNRVDRRVRIAGPILVVTGLVVWWRSGSATAMIAAATGLAVGLWVIAFQRGDSNRRTALRWIALVSVVVTVLAVSMRDQLAQWIGRDATFTGRTSTWDIVIDAWQRRPWFGFGFFAGWFDSDVRAGLREIGYNHWEAHNGYLEVLFGAGVIGTVALVWFIVAAVRALRSSIHERWAPWFVSLVAMSLVVNIGETGIGANRLAWFVLVAGVVSARAVDR